MMGLGQAIAPKQTCLLFVLVAGLLQYGVVQATFAAQRQGTCNITGFTFMPKHLPDVPRMLEKEYAPVDLYTISGPLANLSSTAAACSANAQCGMFTSDGYIIGAYRTDAPKDMPEITTEADILQWQPMDYCSGACCGTWAADGFLAQLARPILVETSAAAAPGNTVLKVHPWDLPEDHDNRADMISGKLRTDLLQTVCAGKPNNKLKNPVGSRVSPPGTPGCPQRCLVACCKQLAAASKDPEAGGVAYLSRYTFDQCSPSACLLCGYADLETYPPFAANAVGTRLFRRYERASKISAAGTPALPSNKFNCTPILGSTAKAVKGSLC